MPSGPDRAPASSPKSAPAQKSGPSPPSTTARTSSATARSPRAATSRSSIAALTALRASGRASVTVATGPSRLTLTTLDSSGVMAPRPSRGLSAPRKHHLEADHAEVILGEWPRRLGLRSLWTQAEALQLDLLHGRNEGVDRDPVDRTVSALG